jgi:hypothetical protein
MKLLLILVDSNHQEDVERILESHNVPGFTEVPNVFGKGETGRKEGTRAFPGSSTLYFTAIEDGACETICGSLKELRDRAGREEGLKAYILDTMEVI